MRAIAVTRSFTDLLIAIARRSPKPLVITEMDTD